MQLNEKYDCIIIGGGPAGISAAIYLARYRRNVLVIDSNHGRSTYSQLNENYLGFPKGITAKKLRVFGQKQAERFGAKFCTDVIENINGKNGNYTLAGQSKEYKSKTIILATGVTDKLPIFENAEKYFGHSLFWCLTCDGYKAIDKKVIVIGNDDASVINCLQFLNYTSQLTFITNQSPEQSSITPEKIKLLKKYNIPFIEAVIIGVSGKENQISEVHLNNGNKINTDYVFSHQGSVPNLSLALSLNIKTTKDGFIEVDKDLRTSVPGVYAAGDITRINSHQIVSAVHEGSIAAQAVNYDLYSPDQQSD